MHSGMDIERYERATGESLPPAQFRMSFDDMCPERLRNRLRDFRPERWPTTEDVRQEISDWLSEEFSRTHKAIGAVEAPAESAEEEWEEACVFDSACEL